MKLCIVTGLCALSLSACSSLGGSMQVETTKAFLAHIETCDRHYQASTGALGGGASASWDCKAAPRLGPDIATTQDMIDAAVKDAVAKALDEFTKPTP